MCAAHPGLSGWTGRTMTAPTRPPSSCSIRRPGAPYSEAASAVSGSASSPATSPSRPRRGVPRGPVAGVFSGEELLPGLDGAVRRAVRTNRRVDPPVRCSTRETASAANMMVRVRLDGGAGVVVDRPRREVVRGHAERAARDSHRQAGQPVRGRTVEVDDVAEAGLASATCGRGRSTSHVRERSVCLPQCGQMN